MKTDISSNHKPLVFTVVKLIMLYKDPPHNRKYLETASKLSLWNIHQWKIILKV